MNLAIWPTWTANDAGQISDTMLAGKPICSQRLDKILLVVVSRAPACHMKKLPMWLRVKRNRGGLNTNIRNQMSSKRTIKPETRKNWNIDWAQVLRLRKFHLISSQYRNKENGHFTQIARDVSFKVGCSVSQYLKEGGWYTTYYVCDYAVTNISGGPVYDEGATASKCKTGTNPKYPALCSESEKYEDSQFINYWSAAGMGDSLNGPTRYSYLEN